MLLTVDIGNTETTLALFVRDRIRAKWRLTTVLAHTPDEWAATIAGHLGHAGHSVQEVSAAVIASVAPAVTDPLFRGLSNALGFEPTLISSRSDIGIRLDVEDPKSVGADRLINAVAATYLYARDTIVVDLGTATTFDCVLQEGVFIGGVISAGIKTASDQLIRSAARLFETELIPPEKVIGRRTEDCIRSGILFGSADSIDGLVRRIKAEWPGTAVPYVVATGGLSAVMAELTSEIEHVEPDLTLIGLRIAAERLGLVESPDG